MPSVGSSPVAEVGAGSPLATAAVLTLLAFTVLMWPDPRPGPWLRRPGVLRRRRTGLRRPVVMGAGVCAAGVLLGASAWATGLATLAAILLAGLVPARPPPLDEAELRDASALLDLVAACLDAGLPIDRALAECLRAVGASGRVAAALGHTAALLALGADPLSAWRPVAGLAPLSSVASAAQRSATGGVRLAGAARECAADIRSACRDRAQRQAARAGVAMTAPLAVCFLPAFLCLGLVPVVISLVSSLHVW